jgi:hypothetical protein
MGQVHPTTKHIAFCVVDAGRGIYESLRTSSEYWPNKVEDALVLALKEGVTRDKKVGQGNGLWGLHEVAVHANGQLSLASGGEKLVVNEDGKIYLYHVRLNHGNTIWVAELSSDLSEIKNNTLQKCISPTQEWENRQIDYKSPPISEGPTVIKHKGTYYLFYSANDFRSIYYAVGYATAPTPTGPWTKFAGNPLISRENIGMNGTGHGDVFFDKQHKMHYVFHTHNNDSTVQTRRTYIVNMKFTQNGTGNDPDRIVVSTKKIMKPELISKQK